MTRGYIEASPVIYLVRKGGALCCSGYKIVLKNPRAAAKLERLPPEQLVESILEKEQRIMAIMGEIQALLRTPG